ncbi:MAG TPA: fumarylacetoacetate hydrolase family protein [Chloroflexia bacterium]|nr:fumarylacetoacetate hydrolase family protein [Chloroflexia bacterium]
MQLLTYRTGADLRPAVVHRARVVDLQHLLAGQGDMAPADMLAVIAGGDALLARISARLDQLDEDTLARSPSVLEANLAAPIPRPGKNVMCIGLNYAEHAAEGHREPPARPTVFTKAPTAVMGPHDPILIDPAVSSQIDWEVELGVIIGRGGRGISRTGALDHVFGYTVINDLSARDIQYSHGGQFFLGKSLDGSCPIGPWIVTRDEVPDPQALRLTSRVNGVVKQNGTTADMIFTVAVLIEWLSRGMTLEPGDILATGTPSGVGHHRSPPEYLQPGDTLESEIAGIGLLRNPVAAWPGTAG